MGASLNSERDCRSGMVSVVQCVHDRANLFAAGLPTKAPAFFVLVIRDFGGRQDFGAPRAGQHRQIELAAFDKLLGKSPAARPSGALLQISKTRPSPPRLMRSSVLLQ